jgi:flagellar basal body-associated protein FliL
VLPSWAILLIVICVAIVLTLITFLGYMVHNERKGEPVFKPLSDAAYPTSQTKAETHASGRV